MKITVKKLTEDALLSEAVRFIFNRENRSTLARWYRSEHSPARTQLFAIFSEDTPYSVCMQMRTHDKNGQTHIYEVTGTEVVNPYANSIKTQGEEKELTLFTCSQKGTMRFVVRCRYKEAVVDE